MTYLFDSVKINVKFTILQDDISIAMLRKFLKKVDVIKRPRSGPANFKSLQIESEELQVVVSQYMFILRGDNGSQKRPWHGGSSVFKAMDGEDEDSIFLARALLLLTQCTHRGFI